MKQFLLSFLNQIQSFFSQAETPITDSTWQEIPESVMTQLENLISQLSHPSPYLTSIEEEIISRLKAWEVDRDENHLVILGSPVSDLQSLIATSFSEKSVKGIKIVYPFSDWHWQQPAKIIQQLKKTTQESEPLFFQTSQQPPSKMIIIPSLEQCFLRRIGGWEAIIWLRENIVNTSDCFWLIGCNPWAWIFLDYVCQLSAYLEARMSLPALSGDDLQQWLNPVTSSLIPEEEDKQSSFFWTTLASLSEGNSEIAIQLWLRSIQVSIPQETDKITELKLTTPSLPKLPALSANDRYLLHSILLHSRIARSQLALSLGEKEDSIQGNIQILRREELIKEEAGLLMVNPIYYRQIKQDLAQNNFLIGED